MKDRNFHRRIGHMGVLAVKKELTQRGWDVFEPEMDCGVDLIAYRDGYKFIRIQVKATFSGEAGRHWAKFIVSRVKYNKKSRLGYSDKEIDFMVGCCLQNNNFWIIPISDVAGKLKAFCTKTDKHYMNWDLFEDFEPTYAFKTQKTMTSYKTLKSSNAKAQRNIARLEREMNKTIDVLQSVFNSKKELMKITEEQKETISRLDLEVSQQNEKREREKSDMKEWYDNKFHKLHEEFIGRNRELERNGDECWRLIRELRNKTTACDSKIKLLEYDNKKYRRRIAYLEGTRRKRRIRLRKYRGLTKQFCGLADGGDTTQESPKLPDIFAEAA